MQKNMNQHVKIYPIYIFDLFKSVSKLFKQDKSKTTDFGILSVMQVEELNLERSGVLCVDVH